MNTGWPAYLGASIALAAILGLLIWHGSSENTVAVTAVAGSFFTSVMTLVASERRADRTSRDEQRENMSRRLVEYRIELARRVLNVLSEERKVVEAIAAAARHPSDSEFAVSQARKSLDDYRSPSAASIGLADDEVTTLLVQWLGATPAITQLWIEARNAEWESAPPEFDQRITAAMHVLGAIESQIAKALERFATSGSSREN